MSPFYIFAILPILINGLLISRLISIDNNEQLILTVLFFPFLIYYFISYFALLFWGNPDNSNTLSDDKLELEHWNHSKLLILSYVSVGKNIKTLENAIHQSIQILNNLKVNYRIEVITDQPVSLPNLPSLEKIRFITVPENFVTKEHSRFKARACEYARMVRQEDYSSLDNKWILHLDEESIVSTSAISGIHEFINTAATINSIGQGEIQYNAKNYARHVLPTIMDTMRTCHDLGYFRMQYKLLKAPLLGIHGSYLLVPAMIEDKIGFDFGPKASITEDLFFGLKALQVGYSFGWINGYIREQSPLNIYDLIKQRRRWINGITFILFDSRIKLIYRLTILISLGLWRIALILLSILLILILNIPEGNQILLLTSILITFSAFQYLIGAHRNIQLLKWNKIQKVNFYLKAVVLSPICVLIETFCLIYALVSPSQQFYVIKKD